jgi:hypothetical protein
MNEAGYSEKWIVYGSNDFVAKELTVFPGRTVTIKDAACYGMIMMQGYGTMNKAQIESPNMIRFGELTEDEYFVSEDAAKAGVKITNHSNVQNIVMLTHFGPDNPDSAHLIRDYKKLLGK